MVLLINLFEFEFMVGIVVVIFKLMVIYLLIIEVLWMIFKLLILMWIFLVINIVLDLLVLGNNIINFFFL